MLAIADGAGHLMMGRRDRSHHVDSWLPEDDVVGGLDVEDTELYDDFKRIRAD